LTGLEEEVFTGADCLGGEGSPIVKSSKPNKSSSPCFVGADFGTGAG